jgi:type III pantothenate kinase
VLIDAGNSRLKWSVKKRQGWSSVTYQGYSPATRLVVMLELLVAIKPSVVVMAHVLGDFFEKEVCVFCEKEAISLTIVNAQAVGYGIKNAYDNASKLGADRFVGLIAVHHQHKANNDNNGNNSIVVSCGTAVTIDAINKQGEHLGGVILPGLQLWKDMLVQGTELLKQADAEDICVLATNTEQGIAAGSLYGLAGAIDRVCNEMKQSLTDIVVLVLTGGGAESLLPYLKSTYKLSPNLVIQGLKIITEIDNDNA